MTTVETLSGRIKGTSQNALACFKGVPYANPPIGALRFSPTQPCEPWTETLRATEYGPPAPQLPSKLAPALSDGMSEDCLTLNVWTPGCDGERRPVMVWIHGGSFLVGSSRNEVSDGARLARRGNVVVVSLNYRVGVFGFLHLAGVAGEEFAQSGNNGLLDQIAALAWVRDNIDRFGGDPSKVTLFGCSAGAISISALMTMPAARGLFHRAICQSGASLARSMQSASAATELLMDHAGAQDVDGLRAMSMGDLLRAQTAALAACPKPDVFFGPVVDGSAIPEPPLHAIGNGRAADMPLLLGTNLDEMRYWLVHNPAVVQIAPERLKRVLTRLTGDGADALFTAYRTQSPEASDDEISVAVLSDLNFTMPAIRMAEAHAAHNPESWMYLFAWRTAAQDGILGSPHAIEQPFVFGTLDSPFAQYFLGEGAAEQRELSDRVQDAWIAFARGGSPGHSGLPQWPPFDSDRRGAMRFDTHCETVADHRGDIRRRWGDVPFDGVKPPVGVAPARAKR